MAISRVARTIVRDTSVFRAAAVMPVRMVSIQERERAIEKAYFNKQEEQLLRKLLNKVKSQADEVDVQAPNVAKTERSKLEAIVGKYKLSPADIDAIIAWRHADDH